MKRFLPFLFSLISVHTAFSQCLNINAAPTPVTCFNGTNGQITINVTSGVGPFTYELYLFRPGFGQTPMGSVNTASTTVVFQQGNGTLSALFETVGIRANSVINPAGNEYRVFVSASGTSGDPFCETLGINGLIVTQPPQLNVTLVDSDPDCNPLVGTGTGKIDIAVSGGLGPYTIVWTGPSSIPNGTLSTASNLDAGTYTVDVTDANSCTRSLNVDLPVATQADAGPPTGVTCGSSSFALAGNTPGAGEIGTWTGPGGVTFSPNANDPNATANNLLPGVNVLRWTITDTGGVCTGTFDEINVTSSPTITLSATVTNVLCNGASTGAIDLQVSGGVAPFSFAWSNGAVSEDITNLSAGVYNVTVTDAALCVAVLNNINVSQPAAVVGGTTTQVNVSCFGTNTGSVTITGTGGAGPYDFSIDGGGTYPVLDGPSTTFPNLIAGTYNLRVRDANGCESPVIPVTITQPAATVTGSTTQVNVTCFAASTGSITITGAGGVAPYDFSINSGGTYPVLDAASNTFTGLAAATYNLVVRDANGCESAVIPVTITQPAAAVGATTSQVNVACFGGNTGSITITGTGGVAPYDFSIDGGASFPVLDVANHTFPNLTAGGYNLRVRDGNGCVSAPIAITITQPLNVGGTISQVNVSCFGASTGSITITGTGGVAPYDFSIDGGGVYGVLDAANNTFTNLVAGTYNLRVRDANNCESPVIPVTITQPSAAVGGTTTKVDVACFGTSTGSITITGTGGVAPYDFSINGGGTYPVLDAASNTFSNLAAGTYNLMVRDANGCQSAVIPVTLAQPASVVSGATTQVNVVCFGANTGSITITGAGGVAPYDFSINGGGTYPVLDAANNTFSNLTAGTYNLRVRDANGCETAVIPVTITQPAAAVGGTTTQVNVACFGGSTGSITITGTGGVGPYDFSIDGGATYPVLDAANNTFTTLAAATYNLSVRDANGCVSAPIPVVITQPAAAVGGTITQVNVDCFGSSTGEITVNGTGGVGPYDFSIDGGATYPVTDVANHTFPNLIAGAYNIKLRDANGCESPVLPVTITEPAEVTATTSAVGDVTVCEGETLPDIVFTFTGVPPFDFTYTDGVTPVNVNDHPTNSFTLSIAPAGTYSVTAAEDLNGCIATNLGTSVTVTVEPAATTEAGNPQTVCSGETATLSGSSVGGSATTGAWTITSQPAGGDGALSDLTQTATPSTVTFTATIAGAYTLRLTTNDPGGLCEAVSDEVVITVSATATVSAGSDQTVCSSGTATLSGTFSGTTGITWSTSGDGTFNDASAANAVYTPGPNDKANGTVTLTITTAGPCASIQDDMTLTIGADPTVDAGAPATICSSANIVLNGSFGGSASGLLWSTSGDGIFDDTTDPNATYVPGFGDMLNGTVTLTATATGSCPGVSDDVIIAINEAAAIDAGDPQTVCTGSPVTLGAVLDGSAFAVNWTTAGDGTFNNTTDPGAVYTPGPNDLADGSVTLTATTNNPPGPCPAASDNVVITFIAIPGDETTPGIDTWRGYVYDDSGDATPIPGRIDFNTTKYRGFIEASDIDNMSGASSYDPGSDEFDLNVGNASPIQGPNVCGSYLNTFSIRYKMDKPFAAGVYRFTIGSDDGVRFFIDGVNVIPAGAFVLQSYTSYTTQPICLSAGVHSLEIQYFENGGESRLTFDYELVPEVVTNSPAQICINSPAPSLTAASADPDVIGFNWYKDGALVFAGANYVPSAAELNTSVAGTTTFEVSAVYACGETQPVEVDVVVFSVASLDIDAQTICESGGVVDLRDFVNATPGGGTFAFSGHPNIAGNNFNPAGLAGSTVSILVDYSAGSCTAPQGTLNLTVTNTADITVPAATMSICEGAADLDLATLVTGSPAGGTFTFGGPQVSGNTFDPSGLSGMQTITVDYNAGGCIAPQRSFNVNVISSASVAVVNGTACEGGSSINLRSLVTPTPAGGTFTFTGPDVTGNFFDPSGHLGAVNINFTYNFSGCIANGSLQVNVLAPTDPLCIGGNCASVVIVPKPEPATCTNSDGRMIMSIKPFTPAINNTGVKITIDGISSTGLLITRTIFNDSVFNLLPVGNYNYSIEYGDPSCIKTGIFSIDQSGTVGPPTVSNVISPSCFGTATGSLTLDVQGETGNVLEWSLDGGLTDPFKPFTVGTQITNIPAGPAPSFQRVISVRRNASDVCYSSVVVLIPEVVTQINATFNITPATCNGNDGAVTGIVASGGNGGPYSYSIDGGQSFQLTPNFNGLAGGAYTVRVRDFAGCERDFAANVTFPGFINSNISKKDADCSNGGDSGTIAITVTDIGTFQVALSTDQFNAPPDSEYLPYSNPAVVFDELPRGQYYVYIKSNSAACPTRTAPIKIFGVYDITFDLEPVCNDNKLSLALMNVTGEAGGAPLEIQVSKRFSTDPPEIIYQQFPTNGEIYLDRNDYAFLKTPGEYNIKIIQFQFEVVCNLTSETVPFTVPSELSAQIGSVAESFPDIPSGELVLNGFTGGLFPYQVRIDLDSASSFSQPIYSTQFETVGVNGNQQLEKSYREIPPGRYQVEVTDAHGCVLDLVARVPLDVDLFVPNVFTPNGDGSNDIFYIRNLPQEPAVNELIITNRWGKEVFVSQNYQNNWDGEGAADGIYFYRLQVSDKVSLTGWVEIIRGPKP